jgi:hypothetical protein
MESHHMTIEDVQRAVSLWQCRAPAGEERSGGCVPTVGGPVIALEFRRNDETMEIDTSFLFGPYKYDLAAALDAFDWHAGLPPVTLL